MFQCRGVWVWSLLGKLRTHMPCGQKTKKKKKPTNKQTKSWKHNIVTKSIQTWKIVHIKKTKKVVESALNPDCLIQSSSFPLNHVSWLWFPKTQQLLSLAPSSYLAFFVLLWPCLFLSWKGAAAQWVSTLCAKSSGSWSSSPQYGDRGICPQGLIPKLVRKCLARKQESGEVLQFA